MRNFFHMTRRSPSLLLLHILFLLCATAAAGQNSRNLFAELQRHQQSRMITAGESLLLQLLAIHQPDSLPQAYREFSVADMKRAGTGLKMEIVARWSSFTVAEQQALLTFFYRPSAAQLPESMISPRGLFKIHYTQSGRQAATEDFVQQVATTFDEVYAFEVERLGYQPPPSDQGLDGPEYDIYIVDHPGYGETTIDPTLSKQVFHGVSSWIQIDNDFTHTPTKGLDAIRVTAAHEFFHMIQLGYRNIELDPIDTRFWFESSATWMEDVVYDSINDYYHYLDYFFHNIERPFYTFDGYHEYGLAVFNHMLAKKYGTGFMRQIWSEMKTSGLFEALDRSLVAVKSNLAMELAEFAVWNFFTAARADTTRFYPEGPFYPQIKASEEYPFNNHQSIQGSLRRMSNRYLMLSPQTSGNLTVSGTFENPFGWLFGLIYTDGEAASRKYLIGGGNSSKTITDIPAFSDVWIVPMNGNLAESSSSWKTETFDFTVEHGAYGAMTAEIVAITPNPFLVPQDDKIEFHFRLNKPSSEVTGTIVTERGQIVRTILLGRRPDGLNKFTWNGSSENNTLVAGGIYVVYLTTDAGIVGPAKFALIR